MLSLHFEFGIIVTRLNKKFGHGTVDIFCFIKIILYLPCTPVLRFVSI